MGVDAQWFRLPLGLDSRYWPCACDLHSTILSRPSQKGDKSKGCAKIASTPENDVITQFNRDFPYGHEKSSKSIPITQTCPYDHRLALNEP